MTRKFAFYMRWGDFDCINVMFKSATFDPIIRLDKKYLFLSDIVEQTCDLILNFLGVGRLLAVSILRFKWVMSTCEKPLHISVSS